MNRIVNQDAKILPGDHDAMTDSQRRSHYSVGCRHDLCRAAATAYQRERKRILRDKARNEAARVDETPTVDEAPAPDEPEIPATFTAGPTIPTGRLPATGATRRLQGLVFAGHSPVEIASATRISVDQIWWLLLGQYAHVAELTHRIIDREFLRLRTSTPEPRAETTTERTAITARCKALATEHDWAGPFAWNDIDNDTHPAHKGTPGAGTNWHGVKAPDQTLTVTEPTRTLHAVAEPLAEVVPIKPAATPAHPAPSPTALAAVRELRRLANAAEAVADALAGES